MTFSCKMDHTIKLLFAKQLLNKPFIGNIPLYKPIVRLTLNIGQVSQITSISESIQIHNRVLRVVSYEPANNVRSNESGAAGDK